MAVTHTAVTQLRRNKTRKNNHIFKITIDGTGDLEYYVLILANFHFHEQKTLYLSKKHIRNTDHKHNRKQHLQ